MSGDESTMSLGLRRAGRWLRPLSVATLIVGLCSRLAFANEPLLVQVGFDQSFKVGQWTPIVVDNVSPQARSCEVIVTDPDGVGIAHPLARRSVDGLGNGTQWAGVVRSGRLDGGLEVRVLGDDSALLQYRKISASKTTNTTADNADHSELATCFPLRQSEPVWLEIGTSLELLKPVAALHAIRSETLPSAAEMPWALDGIDGIWLTSRAKLSGPARVELERWLRRGGHLAVTIATDPEEYQQTP